MGVTTSPSAMNVARPAVTDKATDGLVYEASAAAGTVRLRLGGAARHAVDAAIALDARANLLEAIERWLDMELDWRWSASSCQSPEPASHARVYVRGDEPGGASACIEWPWGLLRSVRPPDEPLACRLRWDKLPAVLALAQFTLDAEELRMLEPGGALLLPESMRDSWHVWLRAADEPARSGVPLTLHAGSAPRARHPEAAALPTVHEVRLCLAHPLAVEALAGWSDPLLPPLWQAEVSLWQCADAVQSDRHIASGALMEWGDGWAMHLRTCNV
jgi:hypothetical protein